MPENHQYKVREASNDQEIIGAIDALTNAFETDPVMSKAMGGKHKVKQVRDLFEFQIETTYLPKGKVDIALDDNGFIVGAALWIDPTAQKGGLLADLKSLPRYAKVLGPALPQAVTTELKLLSARPRFPHWYLYTIGVHSGHRSQGVGSALLDFRIGQLGEHPAYLEASTYRSAALYRRYGFVELGKFKGGKPAVGMWLPAPVSAIDQNLKRDES